MQGNDFTAFITLVLLPMPKKLIIQTASARKTNTEIITLESNLYSMKVKCYDVTFPDVTFSI